MKIHQLEMFLAVAETGSISEAARSVERSRTTVSAAISALEDDLGVTLLARTGNHIELTDIGEGILSDCQRLVLLSDDIRAKCNQHLHGIESAIRIARDDALPETYWRGLFKRLKDKFPKTSIAVYVAPPPELAQMVKNDIVDIAYGILPVTARMTRLQHVDLGQIRMMSVAHSTHPLTKLKKVRSSDLEKYTEITLAYINDDTESLEPLSPISSNYIALAFFEYLRNAMLDGTGWSTVPALLIQQPLRDGTVQLLKHPKAMSWQPYGEIIEYDERRGVVIRWISEQIENYLIDASH